MIESAETAVILWLFSGALMVLMMAEALRGKVELLSLRNLFLVGFILWQLHSAALPLFTRHLDPFAIRDPDQAGWVLAEMSAVFLLIFLAVYARGWGIDRLVQLVPDVTSTGDPGTLLLIAPLLALLSLGLRFAVQIALISNLANLLGVGLAAVAAGLVGWVWSRRFTNPVVLGLGLLTLGLCIANVLSETFGRRGLVAVFAGAMWGLYYGGWNRLPKLRLLARIALCALLPIAFLAVFSSVRRPRETTRTAEEQWQAMAGQGELSDGLALLFGGQDTGKAAMWAIENHPRPYPYRHLMTIEYLLVYPVPRAWWPDKPVPQSILTPRQATLRGVGWGTMTIPVGIIGNAAAEGGWYALVIYAVFFAVFVRFYDGLIQRNRTNPFVVLPASASLGEMLGLARGEPSAFTFIFVFTTASSLVVMLLVGRLVRSIRDAAGRGEEARTT